MLYEALPSIRNQGEVTFGKTKIGHIAFADDLVIFANNDTQIYQKIMILAEKLQKLGLKINAEKKVLYAISSFGKTNIQSITRQSRA